MRFSHFILFLYIFRVDTYHRGVSQQRTREKKLNFHLLHIFLNFLFLKKKKNSTISHVYYYKSRFKMLYIQVYMHMYLRILMSRVNNFHIGRYFYTPIFLNETKIFASKMADLSFAMLHLDNTHLGYTYIYFGFPPR